MPAVVGLSKKDTVTRLRQRLNIQNSLICSFPLYFKMAAELGVASAYDVTCRFIFAIR